MYHVVVVKDEGVELEQFSSLESAIENAEANTEDSEVKRIAIFKYFAEIAEWFGKDKKWYILTYTWKRGHPAELLKDFIVIREKGTPKINDCEVDCVGKPR